MATYAPRHVDIWPWTRPRSSVGTWVRSNSTYALGMGGYFNSSLAQNDEVVYDVALDAGTWTLTIVGYTNVNYGIMTCYLDAASLGTLNWNSGGAENIVKQIAGVVVGAAAVYALKLKITSTPSSGCGLQLVTLTRTGA